MCISPSTDKHEYKIELGVIIDTQVIITIIKLIRDDDPFSANPNRDFKIGFHL